MADGTLTARAGSLGGTSMRYHELALQRWLNGLFQVREGYPVPVVFTSPMDAFGAFAQLWGDANNPFGYLLSLKDDCGKPLYEPYPSPIRYPIISVHRKGWKYRSYQNFSIHRWRHINWPTVSDTGSVIPGKNQQGTGLQRCALGEVTTARRPMAWDYRFQIDFFSNRPDTVAFFLQQFMNEMWRTGGVPQTWIKVPYPGYGEMLVRLYLDGEIESMTPEEPEPGKNVEFRTSITVVVEGFDVDLRFKIYPALWYLVLGSGSVEPTALENAFVEYARFDGRIQNQNPTLDSRTNVPSNGTCAVALEGRGEPDSAPVPLLSLSNVGANQFGQFSLTVEPVIHLNGYTNPSGFGTDMVVVGPVVVDLPMLMGPEEAGGSSRLLVGSMDLYTNEDGGISSSSILGGTHTLISVDGGTAVEWGTVMSGVYSGSYTDTTVFVNAGTESGTIVSALFDGTYLNVTVGAGSYYENGTMFAGLMNGTHTQMIFGAGTFYASGSMASGFLNGTYA